MSVEQLKAKLSEARERYNQIVAATQAQGENVKEIEQRIKVLNQMVEKAKQSKINLHTEIERLEKEKKNKTKQLQRASDTKCKLLADEIQKIEKDAAEKEQIYLTLQARYKILRERWEHKESEYLSKIYELEQNYSQIKAKTNEVISRIQGMNPPRRPGLLFNTVPDVFPDFSNLFSPANIEEEFNSSGSGDATFELELEDEDQNDDDQDQDENDNDNSDNDNSENDNSDNDTDTEFDYEAFNIAYHEKLKTLGPSWLHQHLPINNSISNPASNFAFTPANPFIQGNIFNPPGLFPVAPSFTNPGNRYTEEDDDDALIGEITNIDEEDEEEEEESDKNSLFLLNDLHKMKTKNQTNNNNNNNLQESIEAFFQQQQNSGNGSDILNHLSENKQVHSLTEKVSQLSLQERKLTLEKLKLECRLLQHQRDDLMNEMKEQKT